MMLTARPPLAVSLYLRFMSMPVCRIVSITLSRLTLPSPLPVSASRAALIALTAPHRVALDAGHLDQAADGIAGQPEVVLHPDLGRRPRPAPGVPPISSASPAAAIEQATPTSPWHPISAPEIEARVL